MSNTYQCTASALRIRHLPDGVDTGKRILHGQTVEAHGVSWNEKWLYVTAPAGSGWSGSAFLKPVDASSSDSDWPTIPSGLEEIQSVFGPPHDPSTGPRDAHWNPACVRGEVKIPEELRNELRQPLSWDPDTTVYRFRCHELMVDPFTAAFEEVYRRGLWDLITDFGGCHQYRRARGLGKLSTHSWGISVDLNVRDNPLGAEPKMDPRLVAIFEDVGFLWGGRWSRPDGMHFQWARGY